MQRLAYAVLQPSTSHSPAYIQPTADGDVVWMKNLWPTTNNQRLQMTSISILKLGFVSNTLKLFTRDACTKLGSRQAQQPT